MHIKPDLLLLLRFIHLLIFLRFFVAVLPFLALGGQSGNPLSEFMSLYKVTRRPVLAVQNPSIVAAMYLCKIPMV
jgi:hypothetical protein